MKKIKKTTVILLTASMFLAVGLPVGAVARNINGEEVRSAGRPEVEVTALPGSPETSQVRTISYQETSIAGIPSGFTFTDNLREGSRGREVKYLQILLNTNPETIVAESGAGSPGRETEYFGSRTKGAVVTFQEKYYEEVLAPHGLTEGTGFVGTTTRAKLNELVSTQTDSPGQPEEPEEGTDPEIEALLERIQRLTEALQNLRARLDEIEEGNDLVDVEEGELTFNLLSRPRNEKLGANRVRSVAGFELEAEDSKMTVQRINVRFKEFEREDVDYSRADLDRWIDSLGLVVDGEVVSERSVGRTTLDRDDLEITFSGMRLEVPADDRVEVEVEVRTSDFNISEDKTVYLSIPSDGIRAFDEAGFREMIDGGDLRSFKLLADDVATIEASLAGNSPEEGIIVLDKEDATSDVVITVMELEVEDGGIKLEDLYAKLGFVNAIEDGLEDLYYDGYTTDENEFESYFNDYVDEALLYYEDELIDAVMVRNKLRYYHGGREVFRRGTDNWEYEDGANAGIDDGDVKTVMGAEEIVFEVDLEIDRDTVSTFHLKVDIRGLDPEEKSQGVELVGAFVRMFGLDYVTDEDIDLSINVEGESQKLVSHYMEVSDVDSSISRETWSDGSRDRAEGYLKFDITALGGDVFIDENENGLENESVSFKEGAGYFSLQWADLSISGDYTERDDSFQIDEDDTATITIDFASEEEAKRARVKVESISWGTEKGSFENVLTMDDKMLEDLETRRVELFQAEPAE